METNALIDFWRSIFAVVKERQEQGLPVRYKDVICDDLGLQNGRFKSIPDLAGVDVTDDLVYEFLRQSMASKSERFEEDLRSITLPGEEWKTIPGYSRYKASTLGRIWTSWNGKLLKPQMCGKRYPTVCLYTDEGKTRRVYVHRLVAQTFIPNPEGYETVDHINEDRTDARACNLRWVSMTDNREAYMRNHGYWYNPNAWHPGKPKKRYPCPDNTEEETWKNCIDFPDYFVSDQGRVWSVLSGKINTETRGCVELCSGGKSWKRTVRTLVAAAFLPPKEEGQVIRYRNGDRSDFRACNLYWAHPYKPKSHKRGRPRKMTVGGLQSLSTNLAEATPPVSLLRKVNP